MATASPQAKVWAATFRGDLSGLEDELVGDKPDMIAARVMLHRRRAAVARALTELYEGLGRSFATYLDGRFRNAPTDAAAELRLARGEAARLPAAGDDNIQVQIERAIMTEADERGGDPIPFLDRLLASFPAFLFPAIMAARALLARGRVKEAVNRLAIVEIEARYTRDGSAAIADALRASGHPAEAGQYDLLSLTNGGAQDSRANECAPVDAAGDFVHDRRLPRSFSLLWTEGCLLGNDRGMYYLAPPSLSSFTPGEILDRAGSAEPGAQAISENEPVFRMLDDERRRCIAAQQREAGLSRIFNHRTPSIFFERSLKVQEPFTRSKLGWSGAVEGEDPEFWIGAELLCMADRELWGAVGFAADKRVHIGRPNMSREDLLKLDIRLIVATRWIFEPPFEHIGGLRWWKAFPDLPELADTAGWDNRSPVLAFEDGRPMAIPHAAHMEIERLGAGRFSHWESSFYFSTLDGSDPNETGKSYELLLTFEPKR